MTLRVLAWHIHGSYLNTLARTGCTLYLPVREGRPEGYGGRGHTFDLPDSVIEFPHDRVRDLDLDLVILQSSKNLHEDAPELLGDRSAHLPRIYLEHNTPKPDAVNTRHPFAGEHGLLVHVTRYNALMWDNGDTSTTVIEHSVSIDPAARYTGDLPMGITVANGIARRPRIAGLDLFLAARERVPLTIAGMESEELGGLGDIPYRALHGAMARYRFLFSPMRYTSLPLAVVEAMTIGMPVVALSTTELPSVIRNGVNGYISNDPRVLLMAMEQLIADRNHAAELGRNARETALARFGLDRFRRDWQDAFRTVMSLAEPAAALAGDRR
jgi:hypothetical protein